MCDPNHVGSGCRGGVTALTEDTDGRFSPRICGETTSPKRGEWDFVEKECKCLSVTTAGLVGFGGLPRGVFEANSSCACSSFYVQVHLPDQRQRRRLTSKKQERGVYMQCNGHGTCIQPSFPWGTCSFDLADNEADNDFYWPERWWMELFWPIDGQVIND